MKNLKRNLEKVPPLNYSGFKINENIIEKLEDTTYKVLNRAVGGDAPKKVIKVKYTSDMRRNKWITYIAKTGHKWYPNESISEYLIFRIGKILGFNMAEAKLVIAEEQVRFLSQYFLKDKQTLSHGIDIYANSGYFENKDFVMKIEKEGKAREYFTLQITEQIIEKAFPLEKENIFGNFVKMLIFDAYVGNNDRHYENWGIITHIKNKHLPYFSPIYDTSRALFWNESEQSLKNKFYPSDDSKFINYSENAKPKIGWDNEKNINHFKLFELIAQNECGISTKNIEEILSDKNLKEISDMIDKEFQDIISKERAEIIKSYLAYRRKRLLSLIR